MKNTYKVEYIASTRKKNTARNYLKLAAFSPVAKQPPISFKKKKKKFGESDLLSNAQSVNHVSLFNFGEAKPPLSTSCNWCLLRHNENRNWRELCTNG